MSGTGAFRVATALHAVNDDGDGAGTRAFRAEIRPGWDIGGNANGGYLMAIAGRAMADAVGRPPLSLTAHFLRPGPAGPCDIEVDVVRSGRRLAPARATMRVGGAPTLELLRTFGDQQPDDGPRYVRNAPVDLEPYDRCAPMPSSADVLGPALMDRLACRLQPGDDGFRQG